MKAKPLVSREPKIAIGALPCPFCVWPAMIEPWHGGAKTKVRISCGNEACPVRPEVTGETKRGAMGAWNTRELADG